jgi:UDP-N-acetylglucosamine diphosphorylase/glucosamine-1-phosphate N-acetyltransferase
MLLQLHFKGEFRHNGRIVSKYRHMRPAISIILAAGRGTRMGGDLPKACVQFQGRPLVVHAIDAVLPLGPEKIVVIVGYKADLVEAAVCAHFDDPRIIFVTQQEQLGTGHAVAQAVEHLAGFGGDVLVSYCDVPLLRPATFEALIEANRIGHGATLLSAIVDDPTGYGRIVRGDDGAVQAIVEEKNATSGEKAIREINSGVYNFYGPDLLYALAHIAPNPVNGEYYLTDAVEILNRAGKVVGAMVVEDYREVLGANTQQELTELANIAAKASLQ